MLQKFATWAHTSHRYLSNGHQKNEKSTRIGGDIAFRIPKWNEFFIVRLFFRQENYFVLLCSCVQARYGMVNFLDKKYWRTSEECQFLLFLAMLYLHENWKLKPEGPAGCPNRISGMQWHVLSSSSGTPSTSWSLVTILGPWSAFFPHFLLKNSSKLTSWAFWRSKNGWWPGSYATPLKSLMFWTIEPLLEQVSSIIEWMMAEPVPKIAFDGLNQEPGDLLEAIF